MVQAMLTKILLMIFIKFTFVIFLTPLVKKIAFHVGLVDIPNARKIPQKLVPRLGELGIFFDFLLGHTLFGTHSDTMNSILIGSYIIAPDPWYTRGGSG